MWKHHINLFFQGIFRVGGGGGEWHWKENNAFDRRAAVIKEILVKYISQAARRKKLYPTGKQFHFGFILFILIFQLATEL